MKALWIFFLLVTSGCLLFVERPKRPADSDSAESACDMSEEGVDLSLPWPVVGLCQGEVIAQSLGGLEMWGGDEWVQMDNVTLSTGGESSLFVRADLMAVCGEEGGFIILVGEMNPDAEIPSSDYGACTPLK